MSLDLIASPRAEQIESLFRCAWRPDKLCRGWCDAVGVASSDLLFLTDTPVAGLRS